MERTRWGQERADRVEQRGLAGAGTTREEVALRTNLEVVGAVEGSPVAQLHVVEAPLARVRVLGVARLAAGVFGGGSDACFAQAVEGVVHVAEGHFAGRVAHFACPSFVAPGLSSALAAPVMSSPARS